MRETGAGAGLPAMVVSLARCRTGDYWRVCGTPLSRECRTGAFPLITAGAIMFFAQRHRSEFDKRSRIGRRGAAARAGSIGAGVEIRNASTGKHASGCAFRAAPRLPRRLEYAMHSRERSVDLTRCSPPNSSRLPCQDHHRPDLREAPGGRSAACISACGHGGDFVMRALRITTCRPATRSRAPPRLWSGLSANWPPRYGAFAVGRSGRPARLIAGEQQR